MQIGTRAADTPPRPQTRGRGGIPSHRSVLRFLAPLLLALVILGVAPSAQAASAAEDGFRVTVNLRDTSNDNAPVEGVDITATPTGGEAVQATTDAEGRAVLEIPAEFQGATVLVELDEDTLPDGAAMREGAPAEQTVTLNISTVGVTFLIGEDNRNVMTKWDRVPASIYNGLLFGLIMAMAALGLSMVFGTTGLTNFSHGELVTFGAVCTMPLNTSLGVPFLLAVPITVVAAVGVGWLQDRFLWGPLRHRGIGLIAMMIVSIGLQFFLRNFFAYITGSRTEVYDEYATGAGSDFAGLFTYTTRDIVIAGICIVVLGLVIAGLSYTRLGRATRAVADNPALAAATGINVDRVVSTVWMVGTALAALAGTFLAFQLGVTYQIGQLMLLLLFAACCVGGLGSVWGALVGSLIIGVLIELSALVIPPDLKNAGALLLLVIILLVRPQGLLGRRERIG